MHKPNVTNNMEINDDDVFRLMDLYYSKEFKMYEYIYNSFNHFIDEDLQRILVESDNIFSERIDETRLIRYKFEFSNIKIRPPTIESENRAMLPNDARNMNLTYCAKITASISQVQEIVDILTDKSEKKIIGKIENDVPLTNIPILVRSKYCTLNLKKGQPDNECIYDPGCYFIVKGAEKVVISLERMCENKPFVSIKKDGTGFIHAVQITSRSYTNLGFSQIVSIKMKKDKTMIAKIPIFNDIPALVLFKVLGIESDRDILNCIVYDQADIEMSNLVRTSLDNLITEKGKLIISARDAKDFLINKLKVISKYKYTETDKNIKQKQKEMHLMKLLDNNFLPHISKSRLHKAYFLGLMINKLLQTVLERRPPDDRDSFINKRIDLVGNLYEELFRQYYKKMLHDCSKTFKKRNDSDENPINIINYIKPNIIEQGMSAALLTGLWGKKRGVAQMLQRLTYLQSISFYRRLDAPSVDATTNKLTGPRHYHSSSAGFLCCLTGDTNILIGDGFSQVKLKTIKDGDIVTTYNKDNIRNEESKIHNLFSKDYTELYEIKTITGRQIKCSGDHPVLVYQDKKYNYVIAEKLKQGDLVTTINVSDHVELDAFTNFILDTDAISGQYNQDLAEIGLLNRNLTQNELEITARLIGSINTNGHLGKKKEYYTAEFYVGKDRDAFSLYDDIMRLGFGQASIKRNVNHFKNNTNGKDCKNLNIKVEKNGAFAYYMYLMGGILGNKAESKYEFPQWILKSNKSIKREFLSAFQGGNGCRISIQQNINTWKNRIGPTCQTVTQDTLKIVKQYMEQIVKLFAEFDINSWIDIRNFGNNKKKQILICFKQTMNNLVKIGNIIGYRYCQEKHIKSSLPIEYLRYKQDLMNNKLKQNAEIKTSKCDDMIGYDEFIKLYYVKDDKFHVPIKTINKIGGETTYDFTTKSNNHNFIANGIVVSNCVETPEHAKVGLTKHLSLIGTVSIMMMSQIPIIKDVIEEYVTDVTSVPMTTLDVYTKVFLNGDWLGITSKAIKLEKKLRDMKKTGQISVTVGIAYNILERELKIYCDGGRLYRPVLCVDTNNQFILQKDDLDKISLNKSNKNKITDWDRFIIEYPGRVEYIDVEEAALSMIAPRISGVGKMRRRMIADVPQITDNAEIDNRYDASTFVKYQYCDIHPSFLLSSIATNIPFCNHNQGPRNIFQYAQGKQAMGIYATNYRHRLDKSYILYHPMRPLISTRTSKYTCLDQLPCGENCVVAIGAYTGRN